MCTFNCFALARLLIDVYLLGLTYKRVFKKREPEQISSNGPIDYTQFYRR